MREAGANYVRMRLWVDPPPGYNDLASDLALARQVHAAGMKIYLDIMYSDFWADPTKQNIPAAWAGEDLTQLTATVNSYTRQVISAFAQQGTPVDMVSIGNEIRNGILWPVGEINCTSCGGWDNLAQLLKAGVAGARAGNPAGHELLIMMHYDQGGNIALSSAFYSDSGLAYGVPFDVIGLSYYPFLGRAASPACGQRGRARHRVPQADRASPRPSTRGRSPTATPRSATAPATSPRQTSQLDPGLPGQPGRAAFLRHRRAVHPGPGTRRARRPGCSTGRPNWIPGVPWEPGTGIGSPNVNLTLFNFEGTALPSIGIFGNPAESANDPRRTAPPAWSAGERGWG